MKLKVLDCNFSICKVKDILDVNFNDEFVFLEKTDQEISLICKTEYIPKNCLECESEWKGFRIEGQLDFSLIGIISKISSILAENNICIFVISTYNTDYILVKSHNLIKAINLLTSYGYVFS